MEHLFFVKHKNKPRRVVDYRALIKIAKLNISLLTRTNERFGRLGRAEYFSKMDLKSRFHQILMKPDDIEKTALTIRTWQF